MSGWKLFAAVLCSLTAIAQGAPAAGRFKPVTDEMLRNPPPGDWLMWRRTLNSWGFSPLDQIDTDNVSRLKLVWSRPLADGASQEGIPLVHDGIMYFPNPLDVTQAIDAATGKLIWQHRRKLPADIARYVPFPQTNRNLAIYHDLIIDNGSDDYIYALDAESGKMVWQTKILDYKTQPAKQGAGPLVVNGKLISGRNCMPQAGPDACIVTAHDALTGRELWRLRTIPKPGQKNSSSWGHTPDDKRWHVGAWMVPSYDPKLNLLYIGTSVTAPAPKFMIAGNDKHYLYHDSTLAVNPDTGKIVWYYQHDVDNWDLDHPFERILADVAVAPDPKEVPWINPRVRRGEVYQVVTGIPGKTGIVYTLDRKTGEFLWARPTIHQNVIQRIDGATGAVTMNSKKLFTGAHQKVFVCPSTNGGKNWPAGAYDPRSKVMFFPMENTCMTSESLADKATPAMIYAINNQTVIAPGTKDVGTIRAISAETGKSVWRYEQRAGVTALVATAGGIVFGGDVAGKFRALDSGTGKVLWETNLGSGVTGSPISFAVDGKQYIAVSTGRSNMTGALTRLTPDAKPDSSANRLFVFALGD
jgi:alcohol dehydrogenase (cytochrome c)